MVSHMVIKKALNPANLTQAYPMAATSATTAVITIPIGFTVIAAFNAHWTVVQITVAAWQSFETTK